MKPSDPTRAGRAIQLVLLLGSLAGATILAAWAFKTYFVKTHTAPTQGARGALKSAYVAERVYFSERDAFSESVADVGFSLEPGNRYVCMFSRSASKRTVVSSTATDPEKATPTDAATVAIRTIKGLGLTGHCPQCEITIGCAGNLDDDADLDLWSVSTGVRTSGTTAILPGEPFLHFDDLTGTTSVDPTAPTIRDE